MTVVECYAGFQKMDPPDSSSKLPSAFTSILVEGIAHNTTGSVFRSEVGLKFFGNLRISVWFLLQLILCNNVYVFADDRVVRFRFLDLRQKEQFLIGR